MAMPKSQMKIRKGGVTFESSIDKAEYTITELTRAALRDSARFIRRELIKEYKQLPGMKRNRRIYRSTQYWVRRRENDLVIGHKHDAWYGSRSELGSHGQPARNILRNTVYNNIDQIRIIQGQYLSAIESDNKARGLIDEAEQTSGDGPE